MKLPYSEEVYLFEYEFLKQTGREKAVGAIEANFRIYFTSHPFPCWLLKAQEIYRLKVGDHIFPLS